MRFTILFFGLSLFGSSLWGQDRIVVKDPDLSFSYVSLAGWEALDDPYYYFIVNEANPQSRVSLTYFEDRCLELADCFEAERYAGVPGQVIDYQELGTGKTSIASTEARWLEFSFIEENCACTYTSRKYFFIALDQFFVVTFQTESRYFKKHLPDALKLIESLQVSKN